jgi:hypothetical protein
VPIVISLGMHKNIAEGCSVVSLRVIDNTYQEKKSKSGVKIILDIPSK